MRAEFAQAVLREKEKRPELLFLTGDLGYKALENVRDRFGPHFLNAGVAEQNMISVGAGLASQGWMPLCYSIAPFAVFRPYEQIRTDVCLHDLPVKIVGNGGGYGYGIMGSTHHALEDIGALRTLPNMHIYVPLTSEDVLTSLSLMLGHRHPSYLRLNLAVPELNPIDPFDHPIRHLAAGNEATVVGLGPVVGPAWQLMRSGEHSFDLFAVGQIFEALTIPSSLLASIRRTKRLVVLEEHYANGGMGEFLLRKLALAGILEEGGVRMRHLSAQGYPSGRYGSQAWHQSESSLAGPPLAQAIKEFLR